MSEPLDPAAAAEVAGAPLPTRATLKHRKNVLFQFARFVAFNIKILQVIGQSHG